MNNSDNIAEFFICLSSLEGKTGQLYEDLSKKTDDTSIRSKFLKISSDSKKHASILKEIAKTVGNPQFELKECRRKLSLIFKTIEAISIYVSKKEKITSEDLKALVSALEGSTGEEQFMSNQAKTFQFMSKQISQLYSVDLHKYNKPLGKIVQDEENHRQMLDQIRELLERKIASSNSPVP